MSVKSRAVLIFGCFWSGEDAPLLDEQGDPIDWHAVMLARRGITCPELPTIDPPNGVYDDAWSEAFDQAWARFEVENADAIADYERHAAELDRHYARVNIDVVVEHGEVTGAHASIRCYVSEGWGHASAIDLDDVAYAEIEALRRWLVDMDLTPPTAGPGWLLISEYR